MSNEELGRVIKTSISSTGRIKIVADGTTQRQDDKNAFEYLATEWDGEYKGEYFRVTKEEIEKWRAKLS